MKKTCTICHIEKPLEYFSKSRLGRYGKDSRCKDCKRIAKKAWRDKNIEHCREYNRRWRRENKEHVDAYNREYRERS